MCYFRTLRPASLGDRARQGGKAAFASVKLDNSARL